MGWLSGNEPVEPKKGAAPKLKTPPSAATSQYPLPSGLTAAATIGWTRWMEPAEPWKEALPTLSTPPSPATSQYPSPAGPDEPATPDAGRGMTAAATAYPA